MRNDDQAAVEAAVTSSFTGPAEWAILKRNQELDKAPELRAFASVYTPYVCQCYWFEIFMLVGRVGISVILTLPSQWQGLAMACLCLFYTTSIAFLRPYTRASDNAMEVVVF